MDFISAVKSGFRNYAMFSGRARRSEYWFWQLFYFLISVAVSILSAADGMRQPGFFTALGGIILLGLFLPTLAVLVRRLHDVGRSAWSVFYWGVLPVLLIGPVMLIGFAVVISGALDGSGNSANAVAIGMIAFIAGFLLLVAASTVLFIFTLLDSKPENKYGPSPKSLPASVVAPEGLTA